MLTAYLSSTLPHLSELLEFATSGTTSESKEKSHPSELLEFSTSGTTSKSKEKPHPSVLLGFANVEYAGNKKYDAHDNKARSENPLSNKDPAQRASHINNLIENAKVGVEAEHRLTLPQALRSYPKAILWSMLLSVTIVMEGYDLTIINSSGAFPKFKQAYGVQTSDGGYQITSAWQSALTNGPVVGEIVGLLFNGYIIERIGYRYMLMGSLVMLAAFIFLAVFAVNIGMLMASEVLGGIPWGIFQTLSTTYASEIMPVILRAHLTSNVNLCWLIGQIIGIGVLRGLVNLQFQWSYRIPFALQWVWVLPILIGAIFAPESPWWLVRHGRFDDARKVLIRLTRRGMNFKADDAVLLMKQTNELEKQLSAGHNYSDCFKGVNLRRTEIACMVWISQTLCGLPLTAYATYFYIQAGFSTENAFDLSVGMYGIAIVGQIFSWFLMPVIGRRKMYLWGTGVLFILLLAGGSIGTQPSTAWTQWALGSIIITLTFVYDTTIGPVCYSLVSEIPSTRLRVKTVVLARISHNIANIFAYVLMPEMLSPTAWNWRGKTCFLWAGTCLLCFIWCFFRLPEPKGLTYLELDLLFEKQVKARRFRHIKNTLEEAGYFDITAPGKGIDNWSGIHN